MVRARNSGITLVEVMITLALLGILFRFAPPMLTLINKYFLLSKARLELQREARATMYVLTRELRQAQSTTIKIDQATNQPYYSRIRFTKIQGTSVVIWQQGSSLIMTQGIVVSTMTRNLTYMSFSFPRSDDMTILSVALTLQQRLYSGLYKALHMASEKVRIMN